jgi:hypothetical protein
VSEPTVCPVVDAPSLAEQYVAGRLSGAERAAFEDHFVACAACQKEIRLAAALRTTVHALPGEINFARPRRRGPSGRLIGAGIALAAGFAAVMLLRTAWSPAVVALGRVLEPPVYLGVAVRGTPGRADSIFDRAMTAYAARRYAEAAAGLRSALAAGQDSVPTEFFLGASLLLSDDARAAAVTLEHVVAKGDTPYRGEAQLYQAKALLRLGRGREALEVLAARPPGDPVLASILSALSDSVARVIGR